MIRINPKRMAALAALAFGLGLAGTASAQYTTTFGTAPGGGNTVVGDGPSLGELFTGDGNLSNGGFDSITFNLGSVASTTNSVDTVYITTANNTLLNNGSIYGQDGVNPGDTGFNAIHFTTSPQTVTNNGLISGGAGASDTSYTNSGGDGGIGIYVSGFSPMTGISITNTGNIFGGVGGDGGGGYGYGGTGGIGIYLGDIFFTSLTNSIITNSGTIAGGDGGVDTHYRGTGGTGGDGIAVSTGTVNGFTINNTGAILGGAGQGDTGYRRSGGDGGYAIDIYSSLGISNVVITNTGGLIQGGIGGDAGEKADAGTGGDAIYLEASSGTMAGVSITNTGGSILGGDGGNATDDYSYGGDGGNGVYLYNDGAGISNVGIFNSGLIQGGKGGDTQYEYNSGNGGDAIYIESDNNNLTGVNITNAKGGSLIGGDGGTGNDDYSSGGYGGIGVELYANDSMANIAIVNDGLIQGGKGGDAYYDTYAGYGGDAISVDSDDGDITNFSLKNTGSIIGGNGGNGTNDYASGGNGGYGLYVFADNVVTTLSINNSNLIQGGNGGDAAYETEPGDGGVGVYIEGYDGVSGVTIQNDGNIIGGNGGNATDYYTYSGGHGGEGIRIGAYNNDVVNTFISNSGSIIGGNGGTSGYDETSGYGNDAVYIYAYDGSVNSTGFFNSGLIQGGKGGDGSASQYSYGGDGGYGIDIYGSLSIMNLGIINTANGKILGGNGGNATNQGEGGDGGYGVYAGTNNGDINGFLLLNAGVIAGGKGGNGDDANDYEGGSGGYGVYLFAEENLFNVTINNSGFIFGGDGGNMIDGDSAIRLQSNDNVINNVAITNSGFIIGGSGGFSANYDGGSGYDGIRILGYGGDVKNVSIMNSGVIGAGNGGGSGDSGSYAGGGGDAIEIYSNNNMSNIAIGNSGVIQAGNAGPGGYGGYGGDGVYVDASNSLVNFALNNTGVIFGGNGSGVGYSGGEAVDIYGSPSPNFDKNVVINNFGAMIGGNGLNGADSGFGVKLTTTNAVLNNYGVIAAGSGPNRYAIVLNGGGNTINLMGHSVTDGMIKASGPTDSNVLNIRLSGVSPAVAAQLSAQLAAEGVVPGHDSTGSLTIRGLLIQWDPIIVNLQFSSYQLQGLTPNQQAVGANLDSFTFNPTGQMLDLLNAIDGSGNVPEALETLSPQPFQIYSDIAFANATFNTLEIDHRLNNLRDGSESIDTMGIGGNTDKTTAGFSKDGKNVVVPETKSLEKRWGFFAAGSGLFANVDAHGGDLSDQGFTTSGLMLGVDGKINDHWVAGLLFNYNYTVADLDSHGSKANVQTFGGGAYAGFHDGGWYANGLATYGHNSYDSQRHISLLGFNRTATGSTDGDQYVGNLDGGYDFHITDKVTVGPLAGLQYVHLNVDGFNETGAGAANLAVGSQDADSLRSRIGVHAEYKTQLAKEVAFGTEIHAAWQHEFLDDSRSISGQFIGSGLAAFNVNTTKPQRDAAIAGVGVNFTVRDTMTVFFDYDVQAGQESYLEQSVKGGLKFSF